MFHVLHWGRRQCSKQLGCTRKVPEHLVQELAGAEVSWGQVQGAPQADHVVERVLADGDERPLGALTGDAIALLFAALEGSLLEQVGILLGASRLALTTAEAARGWKLVSFIHGVNSRGRPIVSRSVPVRGSPAAVLGLEATAAGPQWQRLSGDS